MTGAELLALLAALGTGITSAAVYDAIKNAKHLLPIKAGRKEAIEKRWSGHFAQPESSGGVAEKFDISFTLRVQGKNIVGSGEYADGSKKANIDLYGGFYRDDYLHLSYVNHDKAIFQHGLIILHWPNNPVVLTGKFVGIGKDTNVIVSGDIELNA